MSPEFSTHVARLIALEQTAPINFEAKVMEILGNALAKMYVEAWERRDRARDILHEYYKAAHGYISANLIFSDETKLYSHFSAHMGVGDSRTNDDISFFETVYGGKPLVDTLDQKREFELATNFITAQDALDGARALLRHHFEKQLGKIAADCMFYGDETTLIEVLKTVNDRGPWRVLLKDQLRAEMRANGMSEEEIDSTFAQLS